jgi:2-dehydropantoate 2-reductase
VNAGGYSSWTAIAGDRILPGFPGAGGIILDGVVHGQFSSKGQGAVFGEIGGEKSERAKKLAKLFESAQLPYEISENIKAFHLSHATFSAALKHFYTSSGMLGIKKAKKAETVRKVAAAFKRNAMLLKLAGIPMMDSRTRLMSKMPIWVVARMIKMMLNMQITREALLGDHALAARKETMMLDAVFRNRLF